MRGVASALAPLPVRYVVIAPRSARGTMRPPFSFVLSKENAPRPVEKKTACAAKWRLRRWRQIRGSGKETFAKDFSFRVGREQSVCVVGTPVPHESELQNRAKPDLPCFSFRCRCPSRPVSASLPPRGRESKGETGEAPPVADKASLFRGSGTIGGHEVAGNRNAATVFGGAPPPFCVVRGCGGEVETPPRFWWGFGGGVFSQKTSSPSVLAPLTVRFTASNRWFRPAPASSSYSGRRRRKRPCPDYQTGR